MASTLSHFSLVLCIVLTVRGQQDHEGRVFSELFNSDNVDVEQLGSNKVDIERLNYDQVEDEQFSWDSVDVPEAERLYEMFEAEQLDTDAVYDEQVDAEMLEADLMNWDNLEERRARRCTYRCPTGKTGVKNETHIPFSNGCSSKGGPKVSPKVCPYLTDCCNTHDICYGTFSQSKTACDTAFKACNRNAPTDMDVNQQKKCVGYGARMVYVVKRFGCPAYRKAQRAATICV
jgi:hypothetical protein